MAAAMRGDRATGDGRSCTLALMGPFGFGNLGDAATQDAVIANLRARLPGVRLVGISMRPADTRWRHGLETYCYDTSAYLDLKYARKHASAGDAAAQGLGSPGIPVPQRPQRQLHWRLQRVAIWFSELEHAWYVFRALRHIDVLVASGSGQLDETWGGPCRHPLTLFKWALLARLRSVRVVFLSVGAGTIDSRESRRLLRWTLRLAHQCTFRDTGTRDIVRSALGIDRWTEIVPDMAFGLPVDRAARRSGAHGEPLNVAIGVLPFHHPRIWPCRSAQRYDAYLRYTADFCRHVLARGHRITFVVGEVNHDRVVIEDLLRLLDSQPREGLAGRIAAPGIATVTDLVTEITNADVVVASRFHGVLLPLLLERPVLALSYERKVRQLMLDLSQEEHCLELEKLSLGPLCTAFDRLVVERETVSAHLSLSIPAQTSRVVAQFDSFSATLPAVCRPGAQTLFRRSSP